MQEARPFFQAAPQLPPAAPTVPKPAPWAALPLLLQGTGADRNPTDLLGKGRISAGALTAAALFPRGVATTGRGLETKAHTPQQVTGRRLAMLSASGHPPLGISSGLPKASTAPSKASLLRALLPQDLPAGNHNPGYH